MKIVWSLRISSKMFQSSRRDSGSSPDDGSSNMAILMEDIRWSDRYFFYVWRMLTYLVFPINALPKHKRRFMPPDSLQPYSSALHDNFNLCSKHSASIFACFDDKPRNWERKQQFLFPFFVLMFTYKWNSTNPSKEPQMIQASEVCHVDIMLRTITNFMTIQIDVFFIFDVD